MSTAPIDTRPPECFFRDLSSLAMPEWGTPHRSGARFYELPPGATMLRVYARCFITPDAIPHDCLDEMFMPGTYTRRKDGAWDRQGDAA